MSYGYLSVLYTIKRKIFVSYNYDGENNKEQAMVTSRRIV